MLSYLLTIVYFQIPILNIYLIMMIISINTQMDTTLWKTDCVEGMAFQWTIIKTTPLFLPLLHFHKQLFYPLVSDFIISLSLYWNINHPAYWSIRRFGFRDFPNIIMNNSITVLIKLSFVAIYTTSNRDLLNMEGRQDR